MLISPLSTLNSPFVRHRAKFQQPKRTSIESEAGLLEQDRFPGRDGDQQSHAEEQERKHDQTYAGDHYITGALNAQP
jgi:hypothetical protein